MQKLIVWGIAGIGALLFLNWNDKKKSKPGDLEVKVSVHKVGKDVTPDEVSRVMSQLGKKSGKARANKNGPF